MPCALTNGLVHLGQNCCKEKILHKSSKISNKKLHPLVGGVFYKKPLVGNKGLLHCS
jgi:hypothetical protein